MKKIKIGIQGDHGSTNERACNFFAVQHGFENYEVKYLISTYEVLKALDNEEIDYGTFAFESSRGGLVQETQDAINQFSYEKIDEKEFQLDHALLSNSLINTAALVRIFSHPQALKEHKTFLEKEFPMVSLIAEIDTAIAAKKLQHHQYPENSLIIAPIACAEIYKLQVYLQNLPTNKGYLTKIYFVKKA